MTSVRTLTLFFPAYNESANLGECIESARRVASALALDAWEILVVDDGSTDGSFDVISAYARVDARVRVIRHSQNLGYGAAVTSGLKHARYDWFFMTDADLQFRVDDLPLLLAYAGSCSFVQGFRINRADRRSRVILGRLYRGLVHAAAHVPVRDPECSFRLVRSELLKNLSIVSRGPFVPVELVCRAQMNGAVFAEVPIEHHPRRRGVSNALSFRTVRMLLQDFARVARSGGLSS